MKRLVALAALVSVLVVAPIGPVPTVGAQDGGGEVPTQDIIPRPDSGEVPEEAGDRGGSLQLAILGLVVVAILGGGTYLVHTSRRVRRYSATSARMASQADTPSMNPDR